jgi:hypothetical protein
LIRTNARGAYHKLAAEPANNFGSLRRRIQIETAYGAIITVIGKQIKARTNAGFCL